MDLNKVLREVAKEAHDEWWGTPETDQDKDMRKGFVSGYINAVDDLIRLLDLNRKDIISRITKDYNFGKLLEDAISK